MPDKPMEDYLVHALATRVAGGTATCEQGRELLAEFVRWHEHGATPSPRLIEHFANCLSDYLNGKRLLIATRGSKGAKSVVVRTLDQAFGLVRMSRGRPRTDREISCQVAMTVLAGLIAGRTLETLQEKIAEYQSAKGLPLSSEMQVRAAWVECKREALERLLALRAISGTAWTDDEMRRLRKIYRNVPAAVLTSNS